MSFDFKVRARGDSDTFKGALDAFFDSQRSRLPEEAAANASKAAQAEDSTKDAQQAEDFQKQEEEEQKQKHEQAT